MLTALIFYAVLSALSLWGCARFLHDPYHDLHVLPVDTELDIPNLTFDSRGMT